jgi:hypothetical protein
MCFLCDISERTIHIKWIALAAYLKMAVLCLGGSNWLKCMSVDCQDRKGQWANLPLKPATFNLSSFNVNTTALHRKKIKSTWDKNVLKLVQQFLHIESTRFCFELIWPVLPVDTGEHQVEIILLWGLEMNCLGLRGSHFILRYIISNFEFEMPPSETILFWLEWYRSQNE